MHEAMSDLVFLYPNPRSLRGERHYIHKWCTSDTIFQPALPAWRATLSPAGVPALSDNFNPRSPRGERLQFGLAHINRRIISTRAPRVEIDKVYLASSFEDMYFNPRSPRGERPNGFSRLLVTIYFNPRSPRGERQKSATCPQRGTDFNPRSPRGERRLKGTITLSEMEFQPALPAWRATLHSR